jgi:hypothetical protein
MRGRKTAQLAYRLTEGEKEAITVLADEMRLKPAEVVSLVMAQFIDARKQHGNRLIWPPEFNYFPEIKTRQDDVTSANTQ